MTPAERKAVWAGLEKVYRPHMDYEEDPFFGQGGFWQKQPHILAARSIILITVLQVCVRCSSKS